MRICNAKVQLEYAQLENSEVIMQAIQVKYLSATNHRGVRLKAFVNADSVTISRDYSLDLAGNEAKAAEMLAQKLWWTGEFIRGTLPNGEVVYVIAQKPSFHL